MSLVLLNITAFILVVQICAQEVNAFYFRPNAKRKTNYLWALKRFIVYCPICERLLEESEKLRTVYASSLLMLLLTGS